MSHTNETTYYGLPQYVGTDIIDPLVDTNGAYSAIDTALHNVAGSAGQASTDASQAVAAVEAMGTTVSGHTTAIEANAQNIQKVSDAVAVAFDDSATYVKGKVVWYNGKTYQFTANHSGAWTGLDVADFVADDAIAGAEASVETINTKLGNTDISSIGDGSVTGAIDTVNTDVSGVKTALGNTDISDIGDGTVTGAVDSLNTSLIHSPKWDDVIRALDEPGISYTMLRDGWIIGAIQSVSGGNAPTIQVNGKIIAYAYANPNTTVVACGVFVPVKTGDVITTSGANGSTFNVNIYGVN